MTFWKVLLIILLVLWLISLIRIGGRVSYGESGVFVFLLLGPVKLQLFPSADEPGGIWKPRVKKANRRKGTGAGRHQKGARVGPGGGIPAGV